MFLSGAKGPYRTRPEPSLQASPRTIFCDHLQPNQASPDSVAGGTKGNLGGAYFPLLRQSSRRQKIFSRTQPNPENPGGAGNSPRPPRRRARLIARPANRPRDLLRAEKRTIAGASCIAKRTILTFPPRPLLQCSNGSRPSPTSENGLPELRSLLALQPSPKRTMESGLKPLCAGVRFAHPTPPLHTLLVNINSYKTFFYGKVIIMRNYNFYRFVKAVHDSNKGYRPSESSYGLNDWDNNVGECPTRFYCGCDYESSYYPEVIIPCVGCCRFY